MTITYTNHKGRTYYLCLLHQENGQPYYAFTRQIKGEPVETIPNGFVIHENEQGLVYLIKVDPVAPPLKKVSVPTIKPKQKSQLYTPIKARKNESGKYADYPLVNCPVCKQSFRSPNLKWHIRDNHPFYKPANAIAASRLKDESTRRTPKRRQSTPLTEAEQAAKARETALKIVQTECGWCYQRIYQVWKANGSYRYYDDPDLNTRHKCTHPVHWDLDRGW